MQSSHDELVHKKNQEVELLSKEINSLTIRHREAQQKLMHAENELLEVRDQLRSAQTELDTRT